MICYSQLGSSLELKKIIIRRKMKTVGDFDESPLTTLAIDLEDRNYLGSLCCSLCGLQVSFVA